MWRVFVVRCVNLLNKRVSFPVSNKMSSFPFYFIHTDVWDPSNAPNISGAHWFVTFIDDCTQVTWVYLLKLKSEVCFGFLHFFYMVKNQFGVSIKRIRFDNVNDHFNYGLNFYVRKNVLFVSLPVLKLLNKMKLLRERINTC